MADQRKHHLGGFWVSSLTRVNEWSTRDFARAHPICNQPDVTNISVFQRFATPTSKPNRWTVLWPGPQEPFKTRTVTSVFLDGPSPFVALVAALAHTGATPVKALVRGWWGEVDEGGFHYAIKWSWKSEPRCVVPKLARFAAFELLNVYIYREVARVSVNDNFVGGSYPHGGAGHVAMVNSLLRDPEPPI